MSYAIPPCRTVVVCAFRGDRSRPFAPTVRRALRDQEHGRGPGPTPLDCLLYVGHAGISTDGGISIYGFHPDAGGVPVWQLMQSLRKGNAFPGVVHDDKGVFAAAQRRRLIDTSIEVVLPAPVFHALQATLDAERQTSQYSYSFPNGDGDCNCLSWLERMGLPLLTGRIDEFIAPRGVAFRSRRRFGRCV